VGVGLLIALHRETSIFAHLLSSFERRMVALYHAQQTAKDSSSSLVFRLDLSPIRRVVGRIDFVCISAPKRYYIAILSL
jgi:hypothetical protein